MYVDTRYGIEALYENNRGGASLCSGFLALRSVVVAALLLLFAPSAAQAQTLIPVDLPEDAVAEAPIFEDSQGTLYSTLVRVKFGEHVFDTAKGQVTASLLDVRPGYTAVTDLFDQLEARYGTYTIEKMAPSITWGDTLRVNKRTGVTVAISDYSQLFEVWFDTPLPLADVIGDFEKLQEVAYAERPQVTLPLNDMGGCEVPDTPDFPDLDAPPNDPEYENGNQYSLPTVEAAKAWDITRGTDPIRPVGIAILDRFGEDRELVDTHDDLESKLTVLDAFVQGTRHATAVAGLAGAHTDNDDFVASLGWEVELFGFRTNTLGLVALLEELDDPTSPAHGKVDVVNMSTVFIGDPYEDNDPSPGDQSFSGLVRDFLNMGIVVVAGAGNGSCGNNGCGAPPCPPYPAALSYDDLDGGNGTTYQGQVLAATLTDWNDEFFEGVNYSPGADPLADPEAAFIDVAAPGLNVRILRSTLVNGNWNHGLADCLADPGTCSGTSYASPIVAALAALVLSINPTLRVDKVYDIITRSAEKVDQNERPDSFFYTDPQTGESLSWNQYTGYGRVNAYRALVRTLEQYGGTLAQDATIPAGETWNLGAVTLNFAPGTHLIVEGTLNADGTTFTELDTGQGWGGIIADGTLDFDGATVEHAATGVTVYDPGTATIANSTLQLNGTGLDVRSSGGTVVSGSVIEQNGTGVEGGFIACYGASCPCFTSCRGDLDLVDAVVRDNTGAGVFLTDANAFITGTEISGNGGDGLYLSNALADPFRFNFVLDNGTGVAGGTGAFVTAGGDFFLSPSDAIGLNRVAHNADEELYVYASGFAFAGDDTGLTGDNAIFDASGGVLVTSLGFGSPSNPAVDANVVYWGTGGPPPAGSVTGYVDTTLPLACDPIDPPDPGDPLPCSQSRSAGFEIAVSTETAERGGLGAAIRAIRAALAADPASEEAAGLVRRLGALHRRDRADAEGEHATSFGLLRALRGRLNNPNLPEGLRATAEAALEVGVVDALTGERYEAAATAISGWRPRVEGPAVLRVLALVEASLEAQAGRYAEAGALVAAVAASEPDGSAARGLSVLAAHYAGRGADAEGGGARGAPAAAVADVLGGKAAAVGAAEPGLSVYPNPFGSEAEATVALTLDGAAESRVVVYDVLGRQVATLHDGWLAAGTHELALDAVRLPSGVYLVRVEAGEHRFTEQVTVVR